MSEEESKDIISLKIAGIDYQLYCPEEEQQALLESADYLNKKIKKLKHYNKTLSRLSNRFTSSANGASDSS